MPPRRHRRAAFALLGIATGFGSIATGCRPAVPVAAARVLKVPRFRRLPVRGSFFLEYSRYSPLFNLRIMTRTLSAGRRRVNRRGAARGSLMR